MGDLLDLVRANPQFTSRRLPSLYADFRRLKTTNQDGYAANVAAWKSVLTAAITKGECFDDLCCLKADNALLDRLATPEQGRPLAIDVVLDEMVAEKKLVPYSQFFGPYSIYGTRWGVGPVVSWALRTSGMWDTSWRSKYKDGLKDSKYVSVVQLEKLATAVKNQLKRQCVDPSSYTHSVYSRTMFEKEISSVTVDSSVKLLSSADIDCIIQYLSRDQPVLVADKSVVKVSFNPSVKPSEITEQDRAVANLRETASQVNERVESLSSRINSCTEKAASALKHKNKQVAKYALKSRKMAQDAQSSSLDMLGNLEQVLVQIDSASGHLEIVNALQSGVSILGNLNKAIGGAEKVGDLMDELKEQSAQTDEIGREISQLAENVVDEDELESELELMEKQQLETKLGSLPEAPKVAEPASDEVDQLVESTQKLKVDEPQSQSQSQPQPLPAE